MHWQFMGMMNWEWIKLILVTRKPVFGISDEVGLKRACSATEAS